jgi:hypothetical protein
MRITKNLTATEALRMAKQIPGSYAVYGRENNRWHYESMFGGVTGLFYYEECFNGRWIKRDVLEADISPDWVVMQTWEHHETGDTL